MSSVQSIVLPAQAGVVEVRVADQVAPVPSEHHYASVALATVAISLPVRTNHHPCKKLSRAARSPSTGAEGPHNTETARSPYTGAVCSHDPFPFSRIRGPSTPPTTIGYTSGWSLEITGTWCALGGGAAGPSRKNTWAIFL